MKAIVQDRYGSVDALDARDIEKPEIGDDEVLIRVHAASVHVGDWVLMTGSPFVMRFATGLRRPKNRVPAHDHVVRDVPAQNHGSYSVQLQGYFVLCSRQGIDSGACVPAWTFLGGPDPLPLAVTVNGQPLTSTDAIESAADAGNLALINLGPGAVIVGTISGN